MTTPITYQLASAAGYRFNLAELGKNSYDELAYYFKENFPDIVITRRNAKLDIPKLQNTFLWTVNGYVYSATQDGEQLYLQGAAQGVLRSRSNIFGMLNFSGVTTKIDQRRIDASMIFEDINIEAYEKVFINFEQPVTNPLLVMGGYLVFENPEFFYRVSDTMFVLHLHRLNYVEKIYETLKCRDIFAELGVPVSPNNPTQVNASDLRSLATIKKYLTLNNSFLIDLGDKGVQLDKVYLQHSNVPSSFIAHKYPYLPLFVGYGKLAEYLVTKANSERWIVNTQDAVYDNYLFTSQNHHLIRSYNAHRKPGQTYRLAEAFFLDIRSEQD